jgi:hypothetical protein
MRVLIACEESQVVCIAFRNKGHEAYSCDLQPCSGGHPEWHIEGDAIKEAYGGGYDMLIGHPPCTYLSYAGTRWWNDPGRCEKRLKALEFFYKLWSAPIEKICLENPRGCASPTIAKCTQTIEPYYFGDEATKPTWLWLKNLPLLMHSKTDTLFENQTHVGKGEFVYHMTKKGKLKGDSKWYTEAFSLPPEERAKLRSKTFEGIALAMANQWG